MDFHKTYFGHPYHQEIIMWKLEHVVDSFSDYNSCKTAIAWGQPVDIVTHIKGYWHFNF